MVHGVCVCAIEQCRIINCHQKELKNFSDSLKEHYNTAKNDTFHAMVH